MRREPVLAKAPIGSRSVDLAEHSAAVVSAAWAMFGDSGRRRTELAGAWIRFFRLSEPLVETFYACLTPAAALHDIGKASDGFQAAVRGRGSQTFRHEHLSALMLADPVLAALLGQLPGCDLEVVLGAVASHHLMAPIQEFAGTMVADPGPVRLLVDAPEFRGCLELAAPGAGLPAGLDRPWVWRIEEVYRRADDFRRKAHGARSATRRDGGRQRLFAAVRAALIAADSSGSAMVRESRSVPGWIEECFGVGDAFSEAAIWNGVINPRVAELEARRERPFAWHEFQQAAASLGPRALLVAPCGSGKTLAAWRWVAARMADRPARRVVFLYPTRATATEGFRDYVSWAGDDVGTLYHGTAEYDLDGMFGNPGDPRRDGDYHVDERLFALGYWPRRVFSATVDAFLAFMANRYAPTCMLPVMADSVVVIDEVHSFDPTMFSALERFLKAFDVPVLCMTATLPEDRRRVLVEECGLEPFPARLDAFDDLDRASRVGRYRVREATLDEALSEVTRALAAGRRVLWVANTVDRCQEAARTVMEVVPGVSVTCYHSRFRLGDRKRRHEEVIGAFRDGRGPFVAVTTQVCEMSLDLDADVLVTEVAPPPALVQRMGRCCRETIPSAGRVGEVLVYPASSDAPYDAREMRQARDFAHALAARPQPLSQADLAVAMQALDPVSPVATGAFSAFLDCGMLASTTEGAFRDESDFTVDAVLDSDVAEYLERRRDGRPDAAALVLPVPRRDARPDPRLGNRIRLAPADRYDDMFGFLKERRDKERCDA